MTVGYALGQEPNMPPEVAAVVFPPPYNDKRASLGRIMRVRSMHVDGVGTRTDPALEHDCSTTSGYGGAPVVSLETGKVVGIHLLGVYRESNTAVPSPAVTKWLDQNGVHYLR